MNSSLSATLPGVTLTKPSSPHLSYQTGRKQAREPRNTGRERIAGDCSLRHRRPRLGAAKRADLRVRFAGRIRLEFQGAKVTSDAGLLVVSELDEARGLPELARVMLADTRPGRTGQHDQGGLLRQAV